VDDGARTAVTRLLGIVPKRQRRRRVHALSKRSEAPRAPPQGVSGQTDLVRCGRPRMRAASLAATSGPAPGAIRWTQPRGSTGGPP
jgi:hypothetical protein